MVGRRSFAVKLQVGSGSLDCQTETGCSGHHKEGPPLRCHGTILYSLHYAWEPCWGGSNTKQMETKTHCKLQTRTSSDVTPKDHLQP